MLGKEQYYEFKEIIIRYANTEWFKPKGFVHFTKQIPKYYPKSNKIDIKRYNLLLKEISDEEKIAKHSFHPLIHYILKERRYIKKLKERADRGIKIKNRHINYATHIDTHIYSYYAKVLIGNEYEKYLESKKFNDCVIAYRKLFKKKDANNENRYKSNIDFAQDVFDYIKEQKDCVVMTLDITKFFDNLNHSTLYTAWTSLIKKERLPASHYNLYKAITNFRFVDEKDLIKEFEINNKRELRRKNINCYCKTPKDFRERVVKKGLIKKCIRIDKEDSCGVIRRNEKDRRKGIPQGTSISAFLSNLYLLKFDEEFFTFAKKQEMFFYRRYSDDILVVCSSDDYKKNLKYITDKMNKDFFLEINPDKTKIRFFKKSINNKNYGFVTDKSGNNAQIQYLGFDFNGKVVSLKNQGLARFYGKMKKDVRSKAHRAGMITIAEYNKGYRPKFGAKKEGFRGKGIFTDKLYRKYSLMSKANFLGYAQRSAKEIKINNNINNQISRSWNNLQKEICKYNYYEYNSDNNKINFNFF